MSTFQLEATVRESFGKGAARKLRAAGKTPAVVYGHGTDPVHVTVETHPLSLIIRQANALIELDIEGKKELVLVKDVQKDPVPQIIEHVDLLIVKQGEKVEVEVPLVIVGESFSGTNAIQELATVRLSVPATNIRTKVEVNIDGLTAGTRVTAKDIVLDADEALLEDEHALVVNIVEPRGAAEATAEAAE